MVLEVNSEEKPATSSHAKKKDGEDFSQARTLDAGIKENEGKHMFFMLI